MAALEEVQIAWQSAALRVLLDVEWDEDGRAYGIANDRAREAIKFEAGCDGRAAVGALKALVHVGLAVRADTGEAGIFWAATDAARRAAILTSAVRRRDLKAIAERLDRIIAILALVNKAHGLADDEAGV